MGFLFGRKPNDIYKDSLLKLEKELNVLKDAAPNGTTRYSYCNAIVLVRSKAEQTFSGDKEQVERFAKDVNSILEDIKACSAGGTYFDGDTFESTVLIDSITSYIALLSQYLLMLQSPLGLSMSAEEFENSRVGLKNRMKNESLDISMERSENEIRSLEDEAIACQKRIRELEEIGRSEQLTSIEEDRLEREYEQLEIKLERINGSIGPLKKVIERILQQRTDNSRYESLVASIDKLKDTMTLKTYTSIEEFESAAQSYLIINAEIDAEHEFLSDSYNQTRPQKQEAAPRVSGFRKARQEFAEKKQSEINKAEDEINFGTEIKNDNQ